MVSPLKHRFTFPEHVLVDLANAAACIGAAAINAEGPLLWRWVPLSAHRTYNIPLPTGEVVEVRQSAVGEIVAVAVINEKRLPRHLLWFVGMNDQHAVLWFAEGLGSLPDDLHPRFGPQTA
jgi:hypothetical protein